MLLAPLAAAEQRRLLGNFLRARREALTPAQAGQPTLPHARRRTQGLRREEVAQLCGISTTWYTWAEQGRDISFSPLALARLADTLQLTAAERSYVFELALKRDPATPAVAPSHAEPAGLETVLQAMTTPAYLLDRLWIVRGWNAPAGHLFAPWFASNETCLLRYVFLDPTAQNFICDWEDRARRLLAEFRADTANHREDPAIRQLVDMLMRQSESFARFWNNHTILAREGGLRIFNHPSEGILRYDQVTLVPASRPDHKIVLLLPLQAGVTI